jgi:hypothetical protein
MNTRWHEEDVAGRVLEQIERKEIKGRVISIPVAAAVSPPVEDEPLRYEQSDLEAEMRRKFTRPIGEIVPFPEGIV